MNIDPLADLSPEPPPPGGPLPVFYDERRRRWTHTKQIIPILALGAAIVVVLFVLSLISAPFLAPLGPGGSVLRPPSLSLVHPFLESRPTAQARFRYHRVIGKLRRYVLAHPTGKQRNTHTFWQPTLKPYSIVAGFYVNWEASSFASFEKHADQLTHIIPEWLHMNADGRTFSTQEDPERQYPRLMRLAVAHHVAVLPLVNNYCTDKAHPNGYFDSERLNRMLTSPANRAATMQALLQFVRQNKCQGVNIDFEELPDADEDLFVTFLRGLSQQFHRYGLLVTVDVQVDASNLDQLAAAADYLVPMLYDEHNADSTAGPIASQSWFISQMNSFFGQVPPSRTILGIGNYAYDWRRGKVGETETSVGDAVVTAKESEGDIEMDPSALNSHFDYYDDNDQLHDVWMLDALSAYNQLKASKAWEPAGAAVWVIGEEDRALWNFFSAGKLEGTINPATKLSFIPGDYQVDRIGEGEVLDVTAAASDGRRSIKVDPRTGLVVSERYLSYPSPWVIHTLPNAYRPKELALTFDDGPDGRFTPQILDILSRFHVPATFFLVGNNANRFPDLVQREWREGHEIGNHTFFHPNLTEISPRRMKYEIEANERLIELLTGHSTRFFRAPYVVDTDPDTPEEVAPLTTVSRLGLVTVGSNIDPKDYEPGMKPERVVKYILAHRTDGNIILMHDAGGDRTTTVEALPIIIPKLQKLGYKFVTVSALIGGPGHEVAAKNEYLPLAGEPNWTHASDYIAFMAYFLVRRVLATLFMLAIILGLARVLVIGVLAVMQARKERRLRFDPAYQPLTSVLVAAFNEEKVIARTVDAALRSDYANLEVIVIDDGSVDATSAVVAERFGEDPRVRLIRKSNGGKASALNVGLSVAKGEVIVGIDADTIMMPEAVSRLVRHFENPRIGAVAGNVKVGNPVNLLTRWQSLEYITGQNFDRRAYDLLNCITVVPGAIGAWRRSSLAEAGGYLGDTLAEDTDLTYRVRRLGYEMRTESRAVAYTEAPQNIADFRKQRMRWTYGTLQCLWKHRDAMLQPKYGAFGWLALPSLWFYAILLPIISPVMDLMIIWSLFDRATLPRTAFYYGLFFLAELIATLLALVMDEERLGLAFWLFFQRFFYRQLMYQIVWKAMIQAWRGGLQGWGKVARTGSVRHEPGPVTMVKRQLDVAAAAEDSLELDAPGRPR